ncbi:MAG TPA: SDR family NAD(P)-dependent oxidoreductase [Puia sp.]|nr:SDR family NAD(P)-dependent oxidoreductase [Puia sp.]
MNSQKVWYVTGASQGLGLALVKKLLNEGYRVAATSRSAELLRKSTGMETNDKEHFLPLEVDLTNPASIQQSIRQTIDTFGQIDVVVNNAGYGMQGTVEESTEQQIRDIFTINVFATINVTQSALPYLRQQRSGHIINISSVAGFAGAPGWAIYSATKAAVIAFSEVLAADVKELGIKVTVVGPSGFRTGFLAKNSLVQAESKIEDYKAVKNTQSRYSAMDGNQAGDPDKAAELFIALGENPDPPLHLWLGTDALNRAAQKIGALNEELEKWKALSVAADF